MNKERGKISISRKEEIERFEEENVLHTSSQRGEKKERG